MAYGDRRVESPTQAHASRTFGVPEVESPGVEQGGEHEGNPLRWRAEVRHDENE